MEEVSDRVADCVDHSETIILGYHQRHGDVTDTWRTQRSRLLLSLLKRAWARLAQPAQTVITMVPRTPEHRKTIARWQTNKQANKQTNKQTNSDYNFIYIGAIKLLSYHSFH